MEQAAPIIRLRGITREFTSGGGEITRVLNGIDLDIERGSFTVISGESGSGKTTLLRVLGMLDTGFTGRYWLEETTVEGKPDWYLDELRANNLGFIFQEGRLFSHLSLRRNIEIPLQLHGTSDRILIDQKIEALEPSFFSPRERAKSTLDLAPGSASGGQTQRGSIMRAIITEPSIILADEPTASLHGGLKNEVVEHLKTLCEQGHTVIVVSHDSVFHETGRQLLLEGGKLIEKAPGPRPVSTSLPSRMPASGLKIARGWRPRAPLGILLRQAIRETIFRPLFLFLILFSLIVGVCQVSVFTSVILGAQDYVNEKMTEGSRLNRIQIKPRSRDKGEADKFPQRGEIGAMPVVDTVVARRATTTRVKVRDGSAKTFSVSGLHPGDPEYDLLGFLAGAGFSGAHDRPEVILTASLIGEIFDTTDLEAGRAGYDAFVGRRVTILINRYNTQRKLVGEVPVDLQVVGVIAHGEGGRQLYYPNTTLLVFDALVRDRSLEFKLPEGAGPGAWLDDAEIALRADFAWEDSLHVYAGEMRDVMGLYSHLSQMGYKPKSDIWDYKWALDIQDTAWRIFLPLLLLIVVAVSLTVAVNIFTSAKLRETELALWRVLGMRRGDLVLTQVVAIAFSVGLGALAGLGLGGVLIRQTKAMLQQRALQTAEATGAEVQNFDAIFAPVSMFFVEIIVASVVIGVLAALYPAIRTAKTDPAKVLKS